MARDTTSRSGSEPSHPITAVKASTIPHMRKPSEFNRRLLDERDDGAMTKQKMTIKLSEIVSQLPHDAQVWIEGMNGQAKLGTEIILNNVGLESFAKHWTVHRDQLAEIRNF